MRQVQEMAVEFVNALNAAAAAESECAKLRRLLEEERKLVQRLKQEKENEAQMAKRKIERMSQRLAEAQKDVEYATTRADVAEDEWVKLKRELQEALELVQLQEPGSVETRQIVLRQVDHKELELANAVNAASIAESECDKLRTLLEEQRKLVQRLILEKDDEAQVAKRQIEEIGQELAYARKDAECTATRADVAENEWVRLKRELQEALELVQMLKPESEEARQSVLRQADDKELELANAVNAASIAESECDKLRTLLEEERKLLQRLTLEKDDEAQLAKRQIEEIGQQLGDARKNAECAATRADVAENEWDKLKRELQEALELVQMLKPESEEARQSLLRQVDDKELELANAVNAASIAESQCDKLRTLLEEERKLVQRLTLEKDDEAQVAKRQIGEIGLELDDARKNAECAATRADVAESEWTKAKKELQEEKELCQSLKLECDEIRQNAMRQVEEKERELANALHASTEIAGRECAKLKRMLEIEQKLVQRLRLEKDDEAQLAKRQIEEIDQELAQTRKDAELARKDADAAENEWTKVKRDLNNMEEHVKRLELQYQDMTERASRQDGDKALELANAVNATAIAEGECAKLRRMLMEERKTVQRLIREKDDEAELANRQIERMDQELTHARNDAEIAENECAKVKRELREKDEIIKLLKLDIQETRQIAMRQVEETTEEFEDARKEAEHARNDADIAQDEWMKAKKDLQEKLELVRLLELACQEARESAKRQVEEKELQLADALNAATAASSSSAAAQDCVICLTNVKDMAFGCGHMTCEECGAELSTCPICREDITHRIKLFPG